MNTIETTLRETPVPKTVRPNLSRKEFDPTRIFVDRDRLAWFWFIVAGLILVGAAIDRFFLVQSFKQRERVVILDPSGTFHIAPLLKFEEAKELAQFALTSESALEILARCQELARQIAPGLFEENSSPA